MSSDLEALAKASLWKMEEGLKALPECIEAGAKMTGADPADVALAMTMVDALNAQTKALHVHLAATATRAGTDIQPLSGGGAKPPPP